ncbi:alkyl sulfatase dimerization domain-containing protein [Eubacterium callanderi]|uniref:alkyl sulfatase dimerization domain-containing protein n=1 Tax=Eubacterium callanderi TaxID=53442 RepID=UPI001FB5EB2F|nr:alkyl sulfatase dimerization domain-containing protein [Eubacterium callanderi]
MITLPESLKKNWYTRQYYGTVAHNAKAVYQKYMGWYDANPVNLNPLTPSDSAKKYVEYIGDTGEVLKKARADFDKGEYQWVAEITKRNAYLSGAKELREGTTTDTALKANSSADLKKSMTPEMMMDYMGILTDSNAAQDVNLKINLNFTDTDPYLLRVDSGVLLYQKGIQADDADATLTLPRVAMFTILNKDEAKQQETIKIEGDQDILKKLTEHMVTFEYFFNIVEP